MFITVPAKYINPRVFKDINPDAKNPFHSKQKNIILSKTPNKNILQFRRDFNRSLRYIPFDKKVIIPGYVYTIPDTPPKKIPDEYCKNFMNAIFGHEYDQQCKDLRMTYNQSDFIKSVFNSTTNWLQTLPPKEKNNILNTFHRNISYMSKKGQIMCSDSKLRYDVLKLVNNPKNKSKFLEFQHKENEICLNFMNIDFKEDFLNTIKQLNLSKKFARVGGGILTINIPVKIYTHIQAKRFNSKNKVLPVLTKIQVENSEIGRFYISNVLRVKQERLKELNINRKNAYDIFMKSLLKNFIYKYALKKKWTYEHCAMIVDSVCDEQRKERQRRSRRFSLKRISLKFISPQEEPPKGFLQSSKSKQIDKPWPITTNFNQTPLIPIRYLFEKTKKELKQLQQNLFISKDNIPWCKMEIIKWSNIANTFPNYANFILPRLVNLSNIWPGNLPKNTNPLYGEAYRFSPNKAIIFVQNTLLETHNLLSSNAKYDKCKIKHDLYKIRKILYLSEKSTIQLQINKIKEDYFNLTIIYLKKCFNFNDPNFINEIKTLYNYVVAIYKEKSPEKLSQILMRIQKIAILNIQQRKKANLVKVLIFQPTKAINMFIWCEYYQDIIRYLYTLPVKMRISNIASSAEFLHNIINDHYKEIKEIIAKIPDKKLKAIADIF